MADLRLLPECDVFPEAMIRRLSSALAVAGFGDFEVSGLAVPAISTVAVSAEETGRRAGEPILELRAAALRGVRLPSRHVETRASPLERDST